MASSPTPRDIRRLASDHDFVYGAHPAPRRLGWWPFVATHLTLPAAVVAGVIFTVVAIVYTIELSKQMLECPSWANACQTADKWTVENLGTVQGIITMVYLIGMVALAYAALGLCEATIWPLLQKQSFTIRGLNAYLSTTRGSIMLAPMAVMSVRSLAAAIVLACALAVNLLPFASPPLVGHAYSPDWQTVHLGSNYTPGGGISQLYAQTNPPKSVMVRVSAEYNAWASDPASEPMPDYRDWYIDREALNSRGNFTSKAVRFQTSISCRPYQLQQLNKDNLWWNAFRTNMTRTNSNSTNPGDRNSSAEIWVRPQAQLTLWADDVDFVSDRRTRTTLVFAALNGTIHGGALTQLLLGNLTSASSIACGVDIEVVDDILSVGTNIPTRSDIPILSSTDTLTPSPAAAPQFALNELLLWFTVAPLLVSPSVDGTQPMLTNSSATGLPIAYTAITTISSYIQNSNIWTIPGLESFIRLSIGALAQATTSSSFSSSAPSSPSDPNAVITLTTTTMTRKFVPFRALLLLIPPLLIIAIIAALAVYTSHLHSQHSIPVMRQADLGELLKSSQTAWLREVA
ncbi:uncharacterized protein B0T15DRAFT_534248, partial [Chaetomium strumarium]